VPLNVLPPATTGLIVWVGLLSVTIGLLIATVAWRQRDSPGARTYAALMTVLAVWSTMYVVQALQPSVAGARPWLVARHAITPLTAVLFWVFAAEYTDRNDLLAPSYTVPVFACAVFLALLPVTNPGTLYWSDLTLYTASPQPRVDIDFGPAFWFMAGYIILVVGGGHVYIVDKLLDSFSVYRRQLAAMAVVGTIEFALVAVFLTEHVEFIPDLNPWPHVQLITYNMVFVAAPLGWSYFRESLFDLQVLDRQSVIENMEDAVFVFDPNDVLRNVNEPGLALVDRSGPLEDQTVSEVFAGTPVLLAAYRENDGPADDREDGRPVQDAMALDDGDEAGDSVELVVDGESRWYNITVSAIENSTGERTGTVLVARDVTVQRRRRRTLAGRTAELERKTERLERQNERLEQFASVVSHDLRNPLMVTGAHLDLVRDDIPDENVETMERNLGRMETMIDDLLTMARAGEVVESTEPIGLANVVRNAWGHAETDDCDLELAVPGSATVQADRDRLLHVFENLFRNAADHNDPPLTVRVGLLEDGGGFFVEDDGQGIPENLRDEVFEHGYSTGEDGMGLGLAIVRDVVEAHGWTIELADETSGGARFEITGVEVTE